MQQGKNGTVTSPRVRKLIEETQGWCSSEAPAGVCSAGQLCLLNWDGGRVWLQFNSRRDQWGDLVWITLGLIPVPVFPRG